MSDATAVTTPADPASMSMSTSTTKNISVWLVILACGITQRCVFSGVADPYLDEYLAMFPTRATQAAG